MGGNLEFSGERYVPTVGGEIRLEHYQRYAAMLDLVAGKVVLDVACGEGYGSHLLAQKAKAVIGVDISDEIIAHATRAYAADRNLAFQKGDAAHLPLKRGSVDMVVSFETIEHLAEQARMLAEIRRVLRRDGVLVISSPNRPVYSPEGTEPNPFHVKELDLPELDALLHAQFPAVRYFGQRMVLGTVLQPLDGPAKAYRALSDTPSGVARNSGDLRDPVYFVAVCAAAESLLPKLEASLMQPTALDLLEQYRGFAVWARNANEEVERGRALYAQLDAEHHRNVAWAQSLDKELHELRRQYAELAEDNVRRGAWGTALKAQVDDLAQRNAELAEENVRRGAWGTALKAQADDLAQRNAALAAENARGAELAGALKSRVEELQGRLAALEEAHQLLQSDRARLEELKPQLEALNGQLAAKEASAQRQAAENARLGGWVMSLTAEIDALKAQSAREIEERAALVAGSEGRAAGFEREVSALRSSLSWRITAPLRAAGAVASAAAGALGVQARRAWRAIGGEVHRRLPISNFQRRRIASLAYARWPKWFDGIPPYEVWRARQPEVRELAGLLERADPAEVGNLVPARDPSRKPRASVVIPIHGQLDFTLRCIRSILAVRSQTPYEIVVVDDLSPDLSVEILTQLPAIRFAGNAVNEGFIRTCNHGARLARGEHLVFLNNDTVVEAGWLDELVRTFAENPACGLAGSMLVYPDGRLQEAGGIIWSDGSGWNFGRGDDPKRPQYNYLRDVDYLSGASIMVPAGLFSRLGGFDEHYMPAYGEDSDLAFRVRAAGLRVLYQPLSRVVHYEGVTSGTDLTQGAKAYQVANARRLLERWAETLKTHGEPGVDPFLAKDRDIAGRIFVIDHCTPTPDQDAGSITAFNTMRLLRAKGMKVTFAPEDNMAWLERYTADLQRIGVEVLHSPYVKSVREHLAAHGHEYDAVLIFRIENFRRHLHEVELYCPQARLIFHTSDLHHLREARQAEIERSDALRAVAQRTKGEELAAMRRADAVIVHSALEKRLLDEELGWTGQSRLFVFGWAIPIAGTTVGFGPRNGLVFLGGYQHQPNVDAVQYFVREVFPLVRERVPQARFLIVGSKMPASLQELAHVEGVELVGFVEELGPLFDRCRLSIAPLRYGAGTKGKIYTSFSHGLPCVSTTVGAEGMNLVHEHDVLVADSPRDFADAVARLHEDEALWTRLAANGFRFLQAHASLDFGGGVVGDILASIGLDRPWNSARLPAAGAAAPREVVVGDRAQLEGFLASDEARRQRAFEERLVQRNAGLEEWTFPGWCEVCDAESLFRIDRSCGAQLRDDGLWEPNWRERCVCIACGLNTRQRVVSARAKELIAARRGAPTDVYLTEQVTAIFQRLQSAIPQAHFVGSEYLAPGLAGGTMRDGIRHEDVERLSFETGSFDLVISNDVLEHVNDPRAALAELHRVLRSGGTLLMTVPFHRGMDRNRVRSEVTATGLVHYLPEEYHGNPVSDKGSLVFTDFGWEFLEQMRAAGFDEVGMHLYWSEWLGHLGVGQHYLKATK